MKNPNKLFSDIEDIGRQCRCGKRYRTYAAMSLKLNELALKADPQNADFNLYVFKVGFTKNNCYDRWKSIREDRGPKKLYKDTTVYKEPIYAGVGDWKFLKCWDVDIDKYDDKYFKPYLKKSRHRDYVKNISYRTEDDLSNHRKSKSCDDIFTMSEAYARSLVPHRLNDPISDQILGAVAGAVISIVDEWATSISTA